MMNRPRVQTCFWSTQTPYARAIAPFGSEASGNCSGSEAALGGRRSEPFPMKFDRVDADAEQLAASLTEIQPAGTERRQFRRAHKGEIPRVKNQYRPASRVVARTHRLTVLVPRIGTRQSELRGRFAHFGNTRHGHDRPIAPGLKSAAPCEVLVRHVFRVPVGVWARRKPTLSQSQNQWFPSWIPVMEDVDSSLGTLQRQRRKLQHSVSSVCSCS